MSMTLPPNDPHKLLVHDTAKLLSMAGIMTKQPKEGIEHQLQALRNEWNRNLYTSKNSI